MKRNQRGEDKLYVGPENKGYSTLSALYKNKSKSDTETSICIDGVQGTVLISDENIPTGKYVSISYFHSFTFTIYERVNHFFY